eukprot:TRINITY_DN18437_c0_g1_i1.p1 TRINITY_DN18437_c0_g1~~TRINITY_DN18437_c0_g1_i1.p1  ORF type:complete len:348 (+),score=111.85 TRINITY_DN18437_c0_g1_i1:118-1161(+)
MEKLRNIDWGHQLRSFLIGSDWEMLKEGTRAPTSMPSSPGGAIRGATRMWYGASPLMITLRAVFGELTCTFFFILVVCATGANLARAGVKDPVAPALATGLCAVALIYSFADVSGAHFNPAVTFGTIVRRKTSVLKGVFYMVAQFTGATLAILIIHSPIFPNFKGANLVIKPYEDASAWGSFVMEFFMTLILVYVIFATAFESAGSDKPRVIDTGRRKMVAQNLTIYAVTANTKAGFAPIAIGFTLGFLCFVGSTVSGGAFNPARVFGANIVSGDFEKSWIYYLGDFLGAACGAWLQLLFATAHVGEKKEETQDAEAVATRSNPSQPNNDGEEADSIALTSINEPVN